MFGLRDEMRHQKSRITESTLSLDKEDVVSAVLIHYCNAE